MYIYRCTRDEHVTYVVASHIELSRIFCRYCAFSNVIKKFNSLFSRITVANFCNFGKNNNGISYKSLLRKQKNIRSIFFLGQLQNFLVSFVAEERENRRDVHVARTRYVTQSTSTHSRVMYTLRRYIIGTIYTFI